MWKRFCNMPKSNNSYVAEAGEEDMETRPAQPVEMRLRPRRKTFSDNIFPQENYDKMCRRQQRVIVIELSSSSSSSNHRNDHRCNELRLRHWQEKHAARSRTAYRVPRSMFVVVKVAARLQANWGCSWPGLACLVGQ